MESKLIGVLLLIIGVLGYLFKESILRHNMRLYLTLNKNKDNNETAEAEKVYKYSGIIGDIIAILLGIIFLLR